MVSEHTTTTVCLGWPTEEDFANVDPEHTILRLPRRIPCPSKGQLGARAVGPVARMAYMCRQCPCNAVNALVRRHAVRRPPCGPIHVVTPLLVLLVLNFSRFIITHDEWMLRWPAGKRRSIMKSVINDQVDEGRMTSSIKAEVSHNLPTKARLICPYLNLATQAFVAPLHAAFQKVCAFVLDEYELYPGIRCTFASGKNPLWYAKWMERMMLSRKWWYERDGKAWDATMSLVHLGLVATYLRSINTDLHDSVRRSWKTKVYGRTGGDPLVYILNGTQKSGCNDTTTSNTLINLHIVAQTMHTLGLTGDVLACGDDMLAAIDSDYDFDAFVKMEASLGIKPEARKFDRPHDVSFISACWLISGSRAKFVPLPGRVFSRLWWTVMRLVPKQVEAYRRSVAIGLMQGLSDVACVRQFLIPHVSEGQTVGLGYWDFVSPYHRTFSFEETVDALSARYAITPARVLELDQFLSTMPTTPCMVQHPTMDVMIDHDLASVEDRPVGYF